MTDLLRAEIAHEMGNDEDAPGAGGRPARRQAPRPGREPRAPAGRAHSQASRREPDRHRAPRRGGAPAGGGRRAGGATRGAGGPRRRADARGPGSRALDPGTCRARPGDARSGGRPVPGSRHQRAGTLQRPRPRRGRTLALERGRRPRRAASLPRPGAALPGSREAPEALYAIGRIQQESGSYDDAFKSYTAFAERFPSTRTAEEARWRAGWVRYLAGDHAAAAESFARLAAGGERETRVAAEYWEARSLEQARQPRRRSQDGARRR